MNTSGDITQELLAALKEAVDEGCRTVYANEYDEIGAKSCCDTHSYSPHAESCWLMKGSAVIAKAERSAPVSDLQASLTAPSGSPLAQAIFRIKRLRDPATLNALLDGFQSLGMPLGSDRWAEYCLMFLRELREKEGTLRKVQKAIKEAVEATEHCQSQLYQNLRHAMTKEFQDDSARKEREAEEAEGGAQ